ncbi:murein biosynthesis integral membrane protein MurJ [Microlunatus soli]|uniref:Putative peptidoglycan lipid II flippase n=1 Tax=Microlunatus soli TaxID=630515 RepID=A0A1H1XZ09_9ACTN|nr:lipid II flippase MurJ [Microlunatus soli]SDT14488.1 putative peptidoglycan lipid II flippase [Microlunatus soli]
MGEGGRRFAQVAAGVGALALASRIVGFGRWLVFSKTVGDTCLGDAYNSANQLPNVLFEIAAGGILASVVVPVVSRQLAGDRANHEQASRTASALIAWTLLILTPVAIAAMIFSSVYAEAFTQPGCVGGRQTAAALVVIFAPQIWLYGLAVVSGGLLQAQNRFVAAIAAPLASSVVVIATYLIFAVVAVPAGRDDPAQLQSSALAVLGWGTTAGVAALTLTTLIPLLRSPLRLRPTLRFPAGVPAVIISIAGASLAGLIMQQLSVMAGMLTARGSQIPGAWTRATWAAAVYLLPYAVLINPLHQMIFPRLSAAANEGERAIARVLAGIGPAVCTLAGLGAGLLIAESIPVARLLVLGPGSGETMAVGWPVIGYAPAVVGFSLMGLATRALFAEHRARQAGTATAIAWGSVIAGLVVVGLVVPAEQIVTGIAAANSFGMVVGAVIGWVMLLRSRTEPVPLGMLRPALRDIPIGVVAGVGVCLLCRPLIDTGVVGALIGCLAAGVGCVLLFAGGVWLLDRRSLTGLTELWRSRSAEHA